MNDEFTMPLLHSTAERTLTWIATPRDSERAIINHDQTLMTLRNRCGVS